MLGIDKVHSIETSEPKKKNKKSELCAAINCEHQRNREIVGEKKTEPEKEE